MLKAFKVVLGLEVNSRRPTSEHRFTNTHSGALTIAITFEKSSTSGCLGSGPDSFPGDNNKCDMLATRR